ncbi:acetate kinase [Spinactinospora alkalitolerans]|uniref:Acetate kinase n=1 Tax=Spinactinospora alkalitolerans TaxID=687207 RepID=A0A852TPF0_9ACTN|nr:acetate/propionate family kinase [Spinactinospora alkalitolerans]NYE46236.1 acetate kinase [Spinactinospora alkalitolerans]
MRVLVVNTGSASVKLRLLDADNELLDQQDLTVTEGVVSTREMAAALADFAGVDAVGHRVVHGGRDFTDPVRIDDRVLRRLREFVDLAPLHQPKALAGISVLERVLPDVPQVACFDTMFHAGLPEEAATYAIPQRWREEYRPRRYGFHGISHAYAARRSAELLGADPGRLVVAHLGSGASLAAVRGGRSVDTTMGFTPLEGLVMATRSGDVDPGLLLWLLRNAHLELEELNDGLEKHSGLAGLAGTADMREVVERADSGDADAGLGLAVYLHRLRAKTAAMAAALGGLDTLVFTGGVGEHAPRVRSGAAEGLGFLGVGVDPEANDGAGGDAEITAADASVRTLVVTAREDVQIAEDVRAVLGG